MATMTEVGTLVNDGLGERPLVETTLRDVFLKTVEIFPNQTAIIERGCQRSITYHMANALADSVAASLQSMGVRRGDRVAISLGNTVEGYLSVLACYKIGAIAVPPNPAYKPTQAIGALEHVTAKCLFVSVEAKLAYGRVESNTSLLQERLENNAVPSLERIIVVDNTQPRSTVVFSMHHITPWDDMMKEFHTLKECQVRPDDIALIQFTSGTTSAPKGACLTHRNIVNSALIMGERLRYDHRDTICCPLPLFHISGTILEMAISFCYGATLMFPAEAFDPAATVEALRSMKVSSVYAVPTMFIAMLDHIRKTGLENVLHLPEIVVAWGMSELSGAATMSHPINDTALQRTTTVGWPLRHTFVRVVSRDDPLREVAIGQHGELVVSGYLLMQGYWNDVAQTEAIKIRDPATGLTWLRTGDEGKKDARGYVSVTGRMKDVIIRGENIHPAEIENLLIDHPKVQDASVVGAPDDSYGEIVVAFIVPISGANIGSKDVRAWLATRLGRTWLPKEVFIADHLPKTPSGKVQKFELRRKAKQLLADTAKWSCAASGYSEGIQQASTQVVARLIQVAHESQPITERSKVIDVGAGTGAATLMLSDRTSAGRIVAVDIAPFMLDKLALPGPPSNAKRLEKRVLDVHMLSDAFRGQTFTHTVSNMLLHVLEDPLSAVKEMAAVTRSGGTLAIAVTGTPVYPYILWERACRTLGDSFRVSDPFSNRWCQPRDLKQAFDAMDAKDVVIEEISVEWRFRDGHESAKLMAEGDHPGFKAAVAAWTGCRDSALQALVKVFDEEVDFCLKAVVGVGTLP